MQDITPDMEDLLRRASEGYPLKEGQDRWNEIALRIASEEKGNKAGIPGRKFIYAALPFLFLSFFLSFFLLISDTERIRNTRTIQINQKLNDNETSLNKRSSIFKNATKQVIGKSNHVQELLTSEKEISVVADLEKTNQKEYPKIQKINLSRLHGTVQAPGQSLAMPRHPAFVDIANSLEKKIEKVQVTRKRFYYGVSAGIQVSTVKNSGLNKLGYSIGFYTGYRYTKTISLETGISYSSKTYNSKAKYFNTKNMQSTMPAGMKIVDLKGANHVIELPVHLRYNFNQNTANRFFSTIGFSSYLMMEENNQYHVMYNGTEQKLTGSYKSDRRYFAASLDLSVGYEKKFAGTVIRLEPYVQLPARGVGIGSIPVTNFGIRLGINN